ncbi:MAG: ABC transporter ATP-binding protein [Chloroflexi bacterium]|jgi:branched-chain amino acid transport system ATP-binding protein|nr:ABC transporter ATP-binding protein [Chloroflexota bacterium]
MLLEVKDLWVHYGGAEAVRGTSFEVGEGEIVALVGANGAGKTTILRTISGVKHATSGEIRFLGQMIGRKGPSEIVSMGISHCPEGRRVFMMLSVKENLQVGAHIRKDKAEIKRDMEALYESFPVLRERSKQDAMTLSGGEQQMLAIARALMSRPKLLLLDEPSLGLSPIMVQEVARIITNIHRTGVSVLLVEQNSVMALNLADRGYVLETGTVKLEGAGKELLHNEEVRKAFLGG